MKQKIIAAVVVSAATLLSGCGEEGKKETVTTASNEEATSETIPTVETTQSKEAIKNFPLTMDQFIVKWKETAEKLGHKEYANLTELEREDGQLYTYLRPSAGDGVLAVNIDSKTGEVSNVDLGIAYPLPEDKQSGQNSIYSTTSILIGTLNPELDAERREEVLKKLGITTGEYGPGITSNITEGVEFSSVTGDDRYYFEAHIPKDSY